jgi:hypothetical protein
MLSFNEGRVCDAIVRRLEARAKGSRSDLRWPEEERHKFPVEVAFTIGGQLFALEHTGIEPFKGHIRMDAEADRLFKPIVDELKNALGTAAVFELMIPANALQGRTMPEVRDIQRALIEWVKANGARGATAALWRLQENVGRPGHDPRRSVRCVALSP